MKIKFKKPPYLTARILAGSLLFWVFLVAFFPPKEFGLPDDHKLGAIQAGIFVLVWSWVFSIATGLDFGFPKLNFDFSAYRKQKPTTTTTTTTITKSNKEDI